MAELSGAQIVAKSLATQGVKEMFGLVGVPVVPIAIAWQQEGKPFVGVRHEQAAGYAAQAASYMHGHSVGGAGGVRTWDDERDLGAGQRAGELLADDPVGRRGEHHAVADGRLPGRATG